MNQISIATFFILHVFFKQFMGIPTVFRSPDLLPSSESWVSRSRLKPGDPFGTASTASTASTGSAVTGRSPPRISSSRSRAAEASARRESLTFGDGMGRTGGDHIGSWCGCLYWSWDGIGWWKWWKSALIIFHQTIFAVGANKSGGLVRLIPTGSQQDPNRFRSDVCWFKTWCKDRINTLLWLKLTLVDAGWR